MVVANRGRLNSRHRISMEDEPQKLARTRSRSRRPFARARSKSRSRFEVRDTPEQAEDDDVNKFVQYKKFGMYATEISRVIAIDEIPEVEHGYQVVVKVKVSSFFTLNKFRGSIIKLCHLIFFFHTGIHCIYE